MNIFLYKIKQNKKVRNFYFLLFISFMWTISVSLSLVIKTPLLFSITSIEAKETSIALSHVTEILST